MGEFLAVGDYEGQQEDELRLRVGDLVKNVKKSAEDGWLEGEFNGKRGIFPSQYVKEIPASLMGVSNKKVPRSIRQAKAKTGQRWCKAEFTYTPEKADELDLTEGEIVAVLQEIEDGWWLGKKGERVGAFPSNFVRECPAPLDKTLDGAKINKLRQPLTEATIFSNGRDKPTTQENPSAKNNLKVAPKEYCKVMFDYAATNVDELSMKSGEIILVLKKDTGDDGWWEGELNGKTGMFPDNFVMLLTTPSQTKTDQPPARKIPAKGPGIKADMGTEKKAAEGGSKPLTPALKDLKETRDPKVDPASKAATLPGKKVAPYPPVPLKKKPSFNATDRIDGNIPAKPAEVVAVEADTNQFDALTVSTTKLSHPTTDRPKMPGRRPPTNLNHPQEENEEKPAQPVSKMDKVEEKTKPNVLLKGKEPEESAPSSGPAKFNTPTSQPQTKKPQPAKASTGGGPAEAKKKADLDLGDKVSMAELKSEIQFLKVFMEALKAQYERDMVTIKAELKDEKAKRMALQVEVDKVKKLVSQ